MLEKNPFFFNRNLYKQVDGVAMGLPLGPTLANTFLVNFEKIGHKMIHMIIGLVTTGGMLMTYLFYLPHQNMWKPSGILYWST